MKRAVGTTHLQKLNDSTFPKQIDIVVESHQSEKPVSMQGIYKLEVASDRTKQLTYCLAAQGESRPDNFSAPDGSRRTLIRLKRLDDVQTQNWARPAGFEILASVETRPPHPTISADASTVSELGRLGEMFKREAGENLFWLVGFPVMEEH